MKNPLFVLAGIALAATLSIAVQAAAPTPAPAAAVLDKATQEDVQRHRTMSQAHENAAKCLEAGKTDAQCEKQLQVECKGLGIGKFCGMKHTH
jgi:hypothetical protein